MDPVRNPFVPGAGTPPPELFGREALLEQIRVALARAQVGRPARSLIAVGLRGVGKTVLLNRSQQIAEPMGYLVIFIEAQEGKSLPALLVPELRRTLLTLDRLGAVNDQARKALRVFRGWLGGLKLSFGDLSLSLGVDAEPGVADTGILESDLPDLFVALGRAAIARGRPIALMIDELQYLTEQDLGALIMALHRVTQLQLPIVLVAAGLPLIVGLSGQAKSYAERLFDFPALAALQRDDAIRALESPARREGASFAPAALDAILAATRGYPYFLQEWGYHAWNVAAASTITEADATMAHQRAQQRLDEGFFLVRFDRLTPREKDYLRAMAELGPGPHRSGDIARALDLATTDVGLRRDTLIRKGMIWSPAHGDTAFTVPMFDEFMRRAMPAWAPPARAPRKPKA